MNRRLRLSFLPAFFTLLGAVFVMAVIVRVRAYSSMDAPGSQIAASGTMAAPGVPSTRAVTNPDVAVVTEGGAPDVAERVGSSSPVVSAREQRYNELLAQKVASAPPGSGSAPAVQPVPPKPQPSFISKVIAPIVNAFTGNKPAPVPRPQPMSQPPAPRSSGDHSSSNGDNGNKDPRHDKDPSSDTTAPQLVAVDFTPAVVHDGEDVTLTIVATDDLSGIRTISGNIASPSGALQGFACQREAEPNRFGTRLTVPKDAAEGIWKINYLSLTDNASNSVTMSYSQGVLPPSATFRVVSSRPDSTPPSLKAVWLDKPSMRGGEKNIVYIRADDDKSGVKTVSGVFQSPAKFARVGFGCRSDDGTNWSCDFNPPANADCGEWILEQIQLQDNANNMTAIRNENPLVAAVHITITAEQCDSTPPVLQTLVLDRRSISNAQPSTITVTATVTDDLSGVANVSGNVVGPAAPGQQPPRIYFSLSSSGDPQTWTGKLVMPQMVAKGPWVIGGVQILDKANNLKVYPQGDPVLANGTFRVE
jgi:hypothetical protein